MKLCAAVTSLLMPALASVVAALPETTSAGTLGAKQRERVNFDFSWRHHLGNASDVVSTTLGVPVEASASFQDGNWELVDAPHDMLIVQPYDPNANEKQAYLPRGDGWYRKHFHLPSDWEGSSIWLYFEGAFHRTTAWLNGQPLGDTHEQGYTGFRLRLDNAPGLKFGQDESNILALYVNASSGTGWWYEGGGLMRHNWLVRANKALHIVPDSAWAHSTAVSGGGTVVTVSGTELVNDQDESQVLGSFPTIIQATLWDEDGKEVATAHSPIIGPVNAGETVVVPDFTFELRSGEARMWSVRDPHLYTIGVVVSSNSSTVDVINITTGFRTIRWDADHGLFLNGEHVKLRGFCDHSNFGGVGGAIPDRLNLFRAQMLRSVGGNSWRMAHNPPSPTRLDFMDQLGMLAIDENRDYGGARGQGGTTSESVQEELEDMEDMVRRDRSHPSVMIWSFCNEVGCDNETSAAAFRAVSKKWDPTRAVTQNHHGTEVSSRYLDVQGFSHRSASDFESFHSKYPSKPTMASECCSCMSQRGIDQDYCPSPADGGCKNVPKGVDLKSGVFYNNNIGECTASQVAISDDPDFITGTFVWSGFDYLGEARGWPQNTKCRGTIADVAGFQKETAFWLRSWWLSNISSDDAGRPRSPPLAGGENEDLTCFILESWTAPSPGNTTRSINVYTNAESVRLLLNGEDAEGGDAVAVPYFGMATFDAVKFEEGNLTAVCGDERASHTVLSPALGGVAGIVVSVDVPSKATGTGEYLVADGEDTALVRASLVDSRGVVVPGASNNVTFAVVSGAGRIWATHSGDPANLSPSHAPWTPAYGGLARAFVRSTEDAATQLWHRHRLAEIEAEDDPNIKIILDGSIEVDDVVVEARVEIGSGKTLSGRATISMSTNFDRHRPASVLFCS